MKEPILCVLMLVLTSCSLGKAQDSERSTTPEQVTNVTTIRAIDGEFVGGSGLTLYVAPDTSRYELSINGHRSGDHTWGVLTYLDDEAVRTGRAAVGLQFTPGGTGIASLTRRAGGGDVVQASEATFTFELDKGRVIGEVSAAVPESLNATFEGVLGVSCYIPSVDGSSEGGSAQSDPGTPGAILTLDENLDDPACGALRAWATPR